MSLLEELNKQKTMISLGESVEYNELVKDVYKSILNIDEISYLLDRLGNQYSDVISKIEIKSVKDILGLYKKDLLFSNSKTDVEVRKQRLEVVLSQYKSYERFLSTHSFDGKFKGEFRELLKSIRLSD